jgi:hypothetical protein
MRPLNLMSETSCFRPVITLLSTSFRKLLLQGDWKSFVIIGTLLYLLLGLRLEVDNKYSKLVATSSHIQTFTDEALLTDVRAQPFNLFLSLADALADFQRLRQQQQQLSSGETGRNIDAEIENCSDGIFLSAINSVVSFAMNIFAMNIFASSTDAEKVAETSETGLYGAPAFLNSAVNVKSVAVNSVEVSSVEVKLPKPTRNISPDSSKNFVYRFRKGGGTALISEQIQGVFVSRCIFFMHIFEKSLSLSFSLDRISPRKRWGETLKICDQK